nr:MAG TPA: hypothetical protein [Caudoviricetes sp.]
MSRYLYCYILKIRSYCLILEFYLYICSTL